MRNLLFGSILGLVILGCQPSLPTFDAPLSDLLDSLAQVDQAVQTALFTTSSPAEYDSLQHIKEQTFRLHCSLLARVLEEKGYPGISQVGEESSSNFWLMIQHCDKDLDLQKQVLQLLKKEVDQQNASPSNYAYLYDRVLINQQKKQYYGTQLDYTPAGQAFARPIQDSLLVNQRREALGLEPLEDYLAWVTEAHIARNKAYYEAREDSIRQSKVKQ